MALLPASFCRMQLCRLPPETAAYFNINIFADTLSSPLLIS